MGPLPLGTVVLGLATYGFLSVAGHALGPVRYGGFAVLWALAFTIGPGVFLPCEQETARSVASAAAAGRPVRPHVLRGSAQAAGLGLVVLLLVVVAHGPARDLLAGSDRLLLGLCVALGAIAIGHVARGYLAGTSRQTGYAVALGTEGVLRLAGGVALFALGVREPAAYGVLAGLPAAAGALLGLAADGRSAGPALVEPADPRGDARRSALGLLLVASLLAQLLINIGPVAVSALAASGEEAAAGQLLAGLLLARVPLLLVATVQTSLLPGLVRSYEHGAGVAARHTLRLVLGVVAAGTALGVAGAAAIGPAVLRLVFGPGFHLGRLDLALLVAGVGGYMIAVLMGLGLIASARRTALASSWAAGVAVGAVVLALAPGLVRRVELGLVTGAWCTAVLVGVAVLGPARRARTTGEVAA